MTQDELIELADEADAPLAADEFMADPARGFAMLADLEREYE